MRMLAGGEFEVSFEAAHEFLREDEYVSLEELDEEDLEDFPFAPADLSPPEFDDRANFYQTWSGRGWRTGRAAPNQQ